MALTQATITFDVSDYASADFDPRRTKVYSTNNVPGGTVIDTVGNHIFLGSGTGTIGADGTGSISVPTPGTGSNPASWQTTVHIDYPDRNAPSGRTVKSFGPFTITTSANLADLVAEMPVQPEYAAEVFDRLDALEADSGVGDALAALEDRVDGVQDHGNVSGTVTLDPASGYHIFDATGPTEVSLGDPPGYSIAFKAITGADDVTVDGLDDFTLTDDAWATFVHYRDSWHLAASGASGGGDVEPVIDPPTQPGTVTVDPTSDGYNLSWVASTVAAGYEGQIDGGSYTDYGANLTETLTGLASGSSHSGAIRAYNSLGAKSTARTWGPASVDTVGLHEQILALNPLFYYRMSRGAKESFGTSTSAYNSFQYGSPNYTGPALMTGETGSLYLSDSGGPWLGNPDARPDLNGLTQITVIALVAAHGSAAVLQASGLFKASFSAASSGSYVNEYARHGQTHLFGMTGASDGTKGQWRDGVKVDIDNQVWTPGGTLAADSEAAGYSRMGGTPYGGAGAIDMSHIAVIPGVLTGPQMVALAQAAGTYGNPA